MWVNNLNISHSCPGADSIIQATLAGPMLTYPDETFDVRSERVRDHSSGISRRQLDLIADRRHEVSSEVYGSCRGPRNCLASLGANGGSVRYGSSYFRRDLC